MTLLAAITNPTSSSAAATALANPIVLTPGAAPPPPTSAALPTKIPPSDWSLAPADPTLATAASFLAASLAAPSLSPPRFRNLLASFLATLATSLSLPDPSPQLPLAVRSLAAYLPAALAPVVASVAARLAEHDVLLALADSRALPHPPPGLLASLDEAGRPDIVCAVVRQANDLRSSELHAALRCFLSPASHGAYDAMMSAKKQWRDAAVNAVNNCRGVADPVARQAAMLLMMGHDGFTSPEVCLHYLFASGNVDAVILGAAVAELDGGEVVRLMRYLTKWIGKYQRFPEAQACLEAVGIPGLELCASVPSFAAVARALGLVLDEHFSHLVLNAELHEDLKATEVMVRQLAAEAESSGPILDLLRRLQKNV